MFVFLPALSLAQLGPGSSIESPGPPRRGIPSSPPPNVTIAQPSGTQPLGSVPTGTATSDTLPLTMRDAIDRGVRYNIGVISGEYSSRLATAQRLTALS